MCCHCPSLPAFFPWQPVPGLPAPSCCCIPTASHSPRARHLSLMRSVTRMTLLLPCLFRLYRTQVDVMLIFVLLFSRKYLWLSACSVDYAKMEQCQRVHYFVFLTISSSLVLFFFFTILVQFYLSATHFIIIIITTCRKTKIKKEGLKKPYFSKVEMLHGDLWLLLHGFGGNSESSCCSTYVFKLVLF